jgi:putative N-acetyltransferase (TIGR04045 family)
VATIGLLGIPDAVVGTVRIHEQAPGVWVGSRLAVDKAYRSVKGLGKALIHMAVCSAKAQGCKVFYANVQLQNVGLFQKLGWLALGEVNVHGVEHMFMQANLDMYPLTHDPGQGFVHLFNQPARNAFTQRRV